MSLIVASDLTKTYTTGDVSVEAVRSVGFSIGKGSLAAIVGPSGSGKSTLLNLIGCLDRPSEGSLRVLGQEVGELGRRAAARFRGGHIGFIFQDFNLIPVLTAFENVEYPLIMVQKWPRPKRKERVEMLLGAVGMTEHAHRRPDHLSGGQKQRVAIARALAAQSPLVLADEPTANLDSTTAHRIIDLMYDIRDRFGTTFVFSTHDPRIVDAADHILRIADGHLIEDRRVVAAAKEPQA